MMFEEGLWAGARLVLGGAAVQLLLVLEESWEVRLLWAGVLPRLRSHTSVHTPS